MIDERIQHVDPTSAALAKLEGRDKWEPFTPEYSFATAADIVITGRHHVDGKECKGQVQFSGSAFASTVASSYVKLPFPAKGFTGFAILSNKTSNTPVGLCDVNITDSRIYLPSQATSNATFGIWFEYEI